MAYNTFVCQGCGKQYPVREGRPVPSRCHTCLNGRLHGLPQPIPPGPADEPGNSPENPVQGRGMKEKLWADLDAAITNCIRESDTASFVILDAEGVPGAVVLVVPAVAETLITAVAQAARAAYEEGYQAGRGDACDGKGG